MLSFSLAKIEFVNALIASCNTSCSFLVSFALAKSNAVIFFSSVNLYHNLILFVLTLLML